MTGARERESVNSAARLMVRASAASVSLLTSHSTVTDLSPKDQLFSGLETADRTFRERYRLISDICIVSALLFRTLRNTCESLEVFTRIVKLD